MGAAEKTLPTLLERSVPGTGWSAEARADAMARVRAMGLPGRRDEYWRFTRPDALTAPAPGEAAMIEDPNPLFAGKDVLKLVFFDGVFDAARSSDLEMEGITIERLAEANSDIHWAKGLYGPLEARGPNPVPRPLAALNTALATAGVPIHVTGPAATPVPLVAPPPSPGGPARRHPALRRGP